MGIVFPVMALRWRIASERLARLIRDRLRVGGLLLRRSKCAGIVEKLLMARQ